VRYQGTGSNRNAILLILVIAVVAVVAAWFLFLAPR
jgi:hypothetical protein